MGKFRIKWKVKITRQVIPFIMWQFIVRNCYSPEGLHRSYIQLESINDISNVFDGTISLNNLGKFPEFKFKLWLVRPIYSQDQCFYSFFIFHCSTHWNTSKLFHVLSLFQFPQEFSK